MGDNESEGANVRKQFRWMTLCFSVNHSVCTAPLVLASSVLDGRIGFLGNGTLYAMSIISSLLLSVPTIALVGHKGGLIVGGCGYTVYVGCFSAAAYFIGNDSLQYFLYVGGSAVAGLSAGILWTAEGGYMSKCAEALEGVDPNVVTRDVATADLAGDFAMYYLIFEVVGKLAFTFLRAGLNWQVWQIGLLYTVLAFVSMLLLSLLDSFDKNTREVPLTQSETPITQTRWTFFAKVAATVKLWKNPRIWLLSPTNITFGFSAAYLNGYFNAHYEAPDLGVKELGTLTSITVGCAAALSKVYGKLGERCGKGAALTAGALSFGAIPVLILTTKCCHGWGWAIVIFYILQGSGRAVYESTNKAVFSDFFVGEETAGAFANCSLQMSVASAILFFNSGKISPDSLATMVMVSAALTPIVFSCLVTFDKSKQPYQPLNAEPDAEVTQKPSPRD